MRVVVSGGGTGGHIFPALAVAEAVKRLRPDAELLYIGGVSGMETEIVPRHGVPFQAVTARKLRKVVSPATVGVALSLLKGYTEARRYLRAFRAEVVVGTGGYVAAATVLAGASLRLPTVIIEGNAVPGRTNLWLARRARRVCVAFPETAGRFPSGKTVLTGLPLREDIVAPPDLTPERARGRDFLCLAPDRFTVLVIGGSQGAQAVNRIVLNAAPRLLDAGAQIIHQTGPKHFSEIQTQAAQAQLGAGYVPLAFLDAAQFPVALRAADVIVCRGGISTLSEALVNGLPALVIPLPTAYADHQTANAKAFVDVGAAMLRAEAELTGARLADDLLSLRDDPTRRQALASASRKAAHPDAARTVAELTFALLKMT